MERTNSEVERFLLRLGLPQRVIDIFNREQCYELSSFLYLTSDDLNDLNVDGILDGINSTLWEKAMKAVLAGVDEVKVQTEHAWELATLDDGAPFYFNPLTLETRWERPPPPKRKPRYYNIFFNFIFRLSQISFLDCVMCFGTSCFCAFSIF